MSPFKYDGFLHNRRCYFSDVMSLFETLNITHLRLDNLQTSLCSCTNKYGPSSGSDRSTIRKPSVPFKVTIRPITIPTKTIKIDQIMISISLLLKNIFGISHPGNFSD